MSTNSNPSWGYQTRRRWVAALVALDAAAFALVALGALMLRFRAAIPIEHALPIVWFMPVLIVWRFFSAAYCDLYDFRRRLTLSDFVFNAAGASVLAVAGGYFFLSTIQLYYWPETKLSRITAAIDLVGLFLWFAISRAAVLAVMRSTGYRVRLLVLGFAESNKPVVDEIRTHSPKMLTVIEPSTGGTYGDQLAAAFESGPIDQIVIADTNLGQGDLNNLLAQCDRAHAEVYLLPDVNIFTVASTRVYSIAGIPLIPLRPTFLSSVYRPLKRLFDIAASAALLILGLPLFVAVAVAIKLESAGPMFFSQERVGLNRGTFRVRKFRTMIADAESATGPVLSVNGDPRITRVGRFLRKYRVDEWPQLWNVLVGEMSLVGPRPERPEFIDRFIAENPLYERRFLVKPGLTGLAQIHGRYDSDYAHKLRYDLIYINSISPVTDAQILASTIRTVVTAHGAQ